MQLTEGEYSLFSMDSQVQLLEEFGRKIYEKENQEIKISLFYIYKFRVALLQKKNKVVDVIILLDPSFYRFCKFK
jgi:hypothetical protein